MDPKEQELWRMVDVGGYAAMLTFISFTLESLKSKIEKDSTDIKDEKEKINNSYEILFKRFQEMNLNLLDKRFPVEILREIKEKVLVELGQKYKELETLLKFYISGSTHLKIRIINKIKECQGLVKQLNDLGLEFARNDRYWEYRNTNPQRIYLEGFSKKKE
jgi:hypothetical protein